MGFGVTELLIILAIVLVLFGAKKLRNIGGDLGGAIKNFKSAMKEEENNSADSTFDSPLSTDESPSKLDEKSDATIDSSVEKTKEQA